jgi:hypothetical protein
MTAEPLECMNCGVILTADYVMKPIECEIVYMDDGSILFNVYGTGCFCDDECCLSEIDNHGNGRERHVEDMDNCRCLLIMLHAIAHPNEPILIPAPDRSSLRKYGGQLTRDQYKSKSHRYTTCPQVHCIPAKLIVRQNMCRNGVSFTGSSIIMDSINYSQNIKHTNVKASLPSIGANKIMVQQLSAQQFSPQIPGLTHNIVQPAQLQQYTPQPTMQSYTPQLAPQQTTPQQMMQNNQMQMMQPMNQRRRATNTNNSILNYM